VVYLYGPEYYGAAIRPFVWR